MTDLPVSLLGRACRLFLALSYPGGTDAIPAIKRPYLDLAPDRALEPLLAPPVCQALPASGGGIRGYAFRLGSSTYPHLKLQAIRAADGRWVFAVDTHDALRLPPGSPDAEGLARLQAANRRLKEEIERAWEAEGLLTLNALLRRAVTPDSPGSL
jgi:hypothetical protein